jgi:kexin
LSSTPTDVDNTLSRPTRIKPESKPSEVASITPTPTEASSSSFEDNAQKEADIYLSVAYVIFG